MNTEKRDRQRKELFDNIIDQHVIGNWDVTERMINELSKIELIRLTVYLLHFRPHYYIDITGRKKYQIYDVPK